VKALADTSLFVAVEQDRPRSGTVPDELAVSVVTVGELHLGVLLARDAATRARRLATSAFVQATFQPISIDDAVAQVWAGLVADLRKSGHPAPINDTWIAATALAHSLPIVTQDSDYDAFPGLRVIRV
jgi:predicted nucleic acid-binding protein